MEVNNRILELKKRVQRVIDYWQGQKSFAVDIHKGLFKKLDNLRELEAIENMPAYILNAYIIYKRAFYSNWQEEHLKVNQFDRDGYLEKLEFEIEILEKDSLKDFMNELDRRIEEGQIKPIQIIEILRKYNGNK
ncbi:MAG: hypothetical protein MRERV_39c018 [Mycoplasmataceae bacterium RV_VA103A]|nr:MAG: hypothetical protein MRERV_39c018 [Mycoplasmataceae bacterium RV_VA103A]